MILKYDKDEVQRYITEIDERLEKLFDRKVAFGLLISPFDHNEIFHLTNVRKSGVKILASNFLCACAIEEEQEDEPFH